MTLEEACAAICGRRESMLERMREARDSKDAQTARWWQSMAGAIGSVEGILLQVPECAGFIQELHGARREE